MEAPLTNLHSLRNFSSAGNSPTKPILRVRSSDRISELESELENVGQDGMLDNQYVNGFKKYVNLESVTREVMIELLDRINIYPDKRIEIVWKFTDEYESLALSLAGEE